MVFVNRQVTGAFLPYRRRRSPKSTFADLEIASRACHLNFAASSQKTTLQDWGVPDTGATSSVTNVCGSASAVAVAVAC